MADTEREVLESLRLNPEQQFARNLLAFIYARRNMIGLSQPPELKHADFEPNGRLNQTIAGDAGSPS